MRLSICLQFFFASNIEHENEMNTQLAGVGMGNTLKVISQNSVFLSCHENYILAQVQKFRESQKNKQKIYIPLLLFIEVEISLKIYIVN